MPLWIQGKTAQVGLGAVKAKQIMSIVITKAAVTDIPVIQSIAYKTWPSTYDKILSSAQTQYMLEQFYSLDAISTQMLEQNQQFLLASIKGEHMGYAGYELNYKNVGTTKLHKLYVLPTIQGKNIGRTLLNEVITNAKANGQRCLQLNVNRDNIAVHFYNRIGFKVIAQEDIPIGHNYFMNDYIMQLVL